MKESKIQCLGTRGKGARTLLVLSECISSTQKVAIGSKIHSEYTQVNTSNLLRTLGRSIQSSSVCILSAKCPPFPPTFSVVPFFSSLSSYTLTSSLYLADRANTALNYCSQLLPPRTYIEECFAFFWPLCSFLTLLGLPHSMTTPSKIHYLLRAQTTQKNCTRNGTLRYCSAIASHCPKLFSLRVSHSSTTVGVFRNINFCTLEAYKMLE